MFSAAELNNSGVEMASRGEHEGARLSYLAALEIDPVNIFALANLGDILAKDNKLPGAEALFRKLTVLNPFNGDHWNNLGNVLTRQRKFEDALDVFDNAEKLLSWSPALWHNKGLCFYNLRRYTDALRCFEQTAALGGDSLSLQNDVSHALLALGNLDSALETYEARWDSLNHLPPWDFHIPEWKGESLKDKSILLHSEQGYGDTIMTLRFVQNLIDLGARVVVAVPGDMIVLCEAQNWDCTFVNVLEIDEALASIFDYHSPFYSAMRWLEITAEKINSSLYLAAPDITVPPVFRGKDFFNVGICWTSGRRGGIHDWRLRHAPLELWLPLTKFPNVQLWSLQKGPDSEDILRLGVEGLIKDPTYAFDSWAETAAFISKLSLVITVDTAIVHLAGALGVPCWMISQFTNCWRWWEIDSGNGRPWYEAVTIFPQDEPDNWKNQLIKVEESLENIFRAMNQMNSIERVAA